MEESNSQFDRRRMMGLLEAKCNDALSDEGVQELEELLRGSEDARREFWKTIAVHADLEQELSASSDWSGTTERILESAASGGLAKPVGKPGIWRTAFAMAAAACVLVGSFLAFQSVWHKGFEAGNNQQQQQQLADDARAPKPVLGQLSSEHGNSRWSFGHAGDWNSTSYHQGDTISVDEGEVQLELESGTVASLRAPVVLQLVSDDRIRLMRGHIVVDVAKGDEGFTVETASAEVIDLGTVFSVDVAEDGTDVVVFDGAVDLRVTGRGGASGGGQEAAKRFRAGEAVHVGFDETLSRIVNVHRRELVLSGHPEVAPLISAVRDNVSREDMWSFYEIIPKGLEEDARAYVDRSHEWNGASVSGLPAYLLGADYVRTYCDDKITSDFELELELSRPAVVYVFMDNRLAVPDWLLERFEDTGDNMGLDESFGGAGVGPASGVDETFSIWRLVAPQGGVVRLGRNGDTTPEEIALGVRYAHAGMYGIAVAELESVE